MKKQMSRWLGVILFFTLSLQAFCISVNASVPARLFAPGAEQQSGDSEEEQIAIEDAYRELASSSSKTAEDSEMQAKLHDLLLCSGSYIQEKKYETSKTYTADLSFFLQDEDIVCDIAYTGFLGEIEDGTVISSENEEYLFEVDTTGYLTFDAITHERPLAFTILIAKEKIHIEWGDVCEYTLYRGDGSAEALDDALPPFEESEAYTKVADALEGLFADYQYELDYNKKTKTLTMYMEQLRDGMRTLLLVYPDQLRDEYVKFFSQIDDIGSRVYSIIRVAEYPDVSFRYVMVEKLNDENIYPESSIIYESINGETKFDLLEGRETKVSVEPDDNTSSEEQANYSYAVPDKSSSYQDILDEYTDKMENALPDLISSYQSSAAGISDFEQLAELINAKVEVLAGICTDGVEKMAELMMDRGDSYSTYESWASKLQENYMSISETLMNAYFGSALG